MIYLLFFFPLHLNCVLIGVGGVCCAAHAELSNVFWEKLIMEYGVNMVGLPFLAHGAVLWSDG